VLGFELRTSHLLDRHSYHYTSPFLWWVFQDRVSQTICQGLASSHNLPDLLLMSS
jgi:hypothetical protein